MKAIASDYEASCTEPGLSDARQRLLSTMVERVDERAEGLRPLRLSSIWRVATDRSATRIPAKRSCRIAPSPLCVCGHGRALHQIDFIDGDTCEPWCNCLAFRDVRQTVATDRGWSSCSDLCNCGGEHTEGHVYFASAQRMRRGELLTMLLLGPFATHGEALEMIGVGRRLTEKNYARADEYAYGTSALSGDTSQIGALDERYVRPDRHGTPRGDS